MDKVNFILWIKSFCLNNAVKGKFASRKYTNFQMLKCQLKPHVFFAPTMFQVCTSKTAIEAKVSHSLLYPRGLTKS